MNQMLLSTIESEVGPKDDTRRQAEFESYIARFEQAWHEHDFPPIADYLPSESLLRQQVLEELLAIDHEFRGRREKRISSSAAVITSDAKTGRFESQHDSISNNQLKIESLYDNPSTCQSGGLGDVTLFEEANLNRTIAVKQLQSRWAKNERARRAFLREVSITSHLEHPGIVPVHGLGQTTDGRPCYSMRFVKGQTLAKSIEHLHCHLDYSGAEFRSLLASFVMICKTIAYAHSRSVIHRDLKPENIMLGPFGETIVLDWGLAKLIESDQVNLSLPFTVPATALRVSSDDTSLGIEDTISPTSNTLDTLPGDVLGTPAYISPEQAKGDVFKIGYHTDIYGLGAILYAVLTGKAPNSPSSDRTQRTIRIQTPASPSSLHPRVPKALEAICLKALAQNPDDRYSSALDVATDIEKWLASEAVSVYRDPLATRFVRFASKRRTLFWSLATLLLFFVLTLFIGSQRIADERYQRQLASQTAELRKQSAQQITDFLVKTMQTADPARFDGIGFLGAEARPDETTFRRMLDAGYELAETQLTQDPDLRAKLLVAIGSTYRATGNFEKARQLLDESLAIRLERTGPISADTQESKYHLARLWSDSGQYSKAETIYREMIKDLSEQDPIPQLRLADVEYQLAWLLCFQPHSVARPESDSEQIAESVALFLSALDRRESELPADDRAVGLACAGLASAMLCQGGHVLEAELYAARAMEIFQSSDQENVLGSFLVDYMQAEKARREQDFAKAESLYVKLEDQIRKYLGKSHPIYVFHLWNMAGLYRKTNQLEETRRKLDFIREIVKPIKSVRSSQFNVDGLVQYAEALFEVDRDECRKVLAEVTEYANERPKANHSSLERIEKLKIDLEGR